MQQLFVILYKFRFFIVFALLECLALFFTIQNYSYHKSAFVNSSSYVTGFVYNRFFSVSDYLHLKEENEMLNTENTKLKNEILNNSENQQQNFKFEKAEKFEYLPAKIINNNYTKQHNNLTLNVGKKQGVTPDLGVVNSKGVIGIIRNTSENYATVLSILNTKSRINVRLQKSHHFGTMIWNGEDYTITQIIDMPRQAVIKKGDTIVTGNKSAIFPEGIPVGIVEKAVFENKKYTLVNVLLFNDMSSIKNVQVIKNLQKEEQIKLEEKAEDE